MRNALPHLHLRVPLMRSISGLAIVTLQILDHVLQYDDLLKQSSVHYVLLNVDSDLDPLGVRFRPDEVSVQQFQVQTLQRLLNLTQAVGEELRRFPFHKLPWRSPVAPAFSTAVKDNLSRKSFGDVDC